jgi:UDP-N-acetylmuramate dehydrogenase
VADYHGNLIINTGGAMAKDIWSLAKILQERVEKKFGFMLEPEVQLLGEF